MFELDKNLAVIVCNHIADFKAAIKEARRSFPIEQLDSGWLLFCDLDLDEDYKKAKIFSVSDVLAIDPTLLSIIDDVAPCHYKKNSITNIWEKCN
jgi:hypothetical protein